MGANGLQQQMLLVPGSASCFSSGPGMADQLADALSATHLSASPPQASMGPACVLSYPGGSSAAPLSPPNSAAAAAIAAGQRFLASPAASAASSAEFRMQQQQVVVSVPADIAQVAAAPGVRGATMAVTPAGSPYQIMAPAPMMVGPDGQAVYYMPAPQVGWETNSMAAWCMYVCVPVCALVCVQACVYIIHNREAQPPTNCSALVISILLQRALSCLSLLLYRACGLRSPE
jgi:hypothetical protein